MVKLRIKLICWGDVFQSLSKCLHILCKWAFTSRSDADQCNRRQVWTTIAAACISCAGRLCVRLFEDWRRKFRGGGEGSRCCHHMKGYQYERLALLCPVITFAIRSIGSLAFNRPSSVCSAGVRGCSMENIHDLWFIQRQVKFIRTCNHIMNSCYRGRGGCFRHGSGNRLPLYHHQWNPLHGIGGNGASICRFMVFSWSIRRWNYYTSDFWGFI